MANTYVDYTAVASQTDYNFSFERDEHVKVKVNDVIVTNYTIVTSPTPTKIRFNTAPTAGAEIRIYRDSRGDFSPLVDFVDGSVLTENELDEAYKHNLFVSQEASEGTGNELLNKKGGANYDAEGNKIIDLGTPTAATDAANKAYTDQTIDNAIALGGSPAIVSLGGYDVTAFGRSITKSLANWTNDLISYNVNVLDYIPTSYHASILDGTIDTDLFDYINSAWTDALADGKSMYFPSGTYLSKSNNFPMGRVSGAVPTSLLDCKNITVFGDGRSTILKTKTATGADVLQINGAKNFHVRDLSITSELTGSTGAGSNCVSITNGGDNITFENVFAYNAAYIDKTSYLDGGKGFTVQTGTPSVSLGKILFSNCIADGCTYGFDFTPVYSYLINQNPSIIIDNCIAENCWYGYLVNAGASTVAIPAGWSIGTKFSGMANNCQKGVVLGRGHGVDVDVKVITNKTKANLKLDPTGSAWSTTLATEATGAELLYAHNSKVNITGYLKEVDKKVRVGGANAGSSGLSGATDTCELYFDIGGTAVTDIELINSGGNRVRKSVIYISATTTATVDSNFYLTAYDNTIIYSGLAGGALADGIRLINPNIDGALNFPQTSGGISYVNIQKSDLGISVQQTGASSGTNKNFIVKDDAGNNEFVVYNNGELAFNLSASATGLGSLTQVIAIRNPATDTISGYIPVYSSFTP
jgi:hypothetical protein